MKTFLTISTLALLSASTMAHAKFEANEENFKNRHVMYTRLSNLGTKQRYESNQAVRAAIQLEADIISTYNQLVFGAVGQKPNTLTEKQYLDKTLGAYIQARTYRKSISPKFNPETADYGQFQGRLSYLLSKEHNQGVNYFINYFPDHQKAGLGDLRFNYTKAKAAKDATKAKEKELFEARAANQDYVAAAEWLKTYKK